MYFCRKLVGDMAKNSNWQDDYWLLLMQLYLQKPVGLKPMYSRRMVELSIEIHISPVSLFNKMCQLANLETPRVERLWETYGQNPKKLARAARLMREMNGFNNAEEFYSGVEVNESFEKDFKPIAEGEVLTPVMLTLILDLYFRLTPITMVAATPEVQELAKLIGIRSAEVEEVLRTFQCCDPYLKRKGDATDRLLEPCREIWRRYGNADTQSLASYAAQLKEYFK
jgi:hypothetical protein